MRKFWVGIFVGLLVGAILATASFSLAGQPIKLVVNGREVSCDPSPQIIDNHVFVPLRFVAEALGATVEWDETNNAVYVNSAFTIATITIQTPQGMRVITFPAFSDKLIE